MSSYPETEQRIREAAFRALTTHGYANLSIFEPDDLEAGYLDTAGIPLEIVDTDEPIRSKLGLCLNVAESSVST